MSGIITGKGKKVNTLPGALFGLEPPSPYISALFSYTAKMDKMKAKMEKEKAHEVTFPTKDLARYVKAISISPHILYKN